MWSIVDGPLDKILTSLNHLVQYCRDVSGRPCAQKHKLLGRLYAWWLQKSHTGSEKISEMFLKSNRKLSTGKSFFVRSCNQPHNSIWFRNKRRIVCAIIIFIWFKGKLKALSRNGLSLIVTTSRSFLFRVKFKVISSYHSDNNLLEIRPLKWKGARLHSILHRNRDLFSLKDSFWKVCPCSDN